MITVASNRVRRERAPVSLLHVKQPLHGLLIVHVITCEICRQDEYYCFGLQKRKRQQRIRSGRDPQGQRRKPRCFRKALTRG